MVFCPKLVRTSHLKNSWHLFVSFSFFFFFGNMALVEEKEEIVNLNGSRTAKESK